MATATLANTRLSLVNGTAFADFSASGTLAPFLNHRLTVYDSTGKKASGYIKAAGTGETLDTELVDGWTNHAIAPFETFTTSGSSITQAINSTTQGICYKAATLTVGAVYKLVHTVSLTSGTRPAFRSGNNTNVSPSYGTLFQAASVTTTGVYRTLENGLGASQTHLGYRNETGEASNFAVADFSFKKLLTPSSTGVTITSTPGGTTYNWESIEAGFNYNDASGYSFYVTTSSSGIYKRRMRLLKR